MVGEELDASYMAGNTMDYAFIHGNAIKNAGYSFVSCSRQAFEDGTVKPINFDVVDLYLGAQYERGDSPIARSSYYNVGPAMYTILAAYTMQGGALMVSGSYLGEESLSMPSVQALLNQVMHANYNGAISDWSVQSISALGTTLEIPRWINPEQ